MQTNRIWLILTLMAVPAMAAEQKGVEVTPLAGYGIGGTFEQVLTVSPYTSRKLDLNESGLFGIAVDVDITDQTQYEFYFSQQQTKLTDSSGGALPSSLFDMNVNYIHVGGVLSFGDKRVDPFIVGTLGATHFDPDHASYSSKTLFSIGLGGGVKLFLTDNIGFRFEGRGFGTLHSGGGYIYSGSGGTQIGIYGDVLWQAQFNAGLIVRF